MTRGGGRRKIRRKGVTEAEGGKFLKGGNGHGGNTSAITGEIIGKWIWY